MRLSMKRCVKYISVLAGIGLVLCYIFQKIHRQMTPPSIIMLPMNNATYPRHLLSTDRWVEVDAEDSLFVFNAYFKGRKDGVVEIIAAASSFGKMYECVLWYPSNGDANDVTGRAVRVKFVPFHASTRRYVAARLLCQLPGNDIPSSVTIVSKDADRFHNLLPVTRIRSRDYIHNFTVCPAPLNLNYGRAYELVEFIELNRILGADKFIFYNYSIASNVDHVLREYSKRGIAEVVPWQLPMHVDTWPPTYERPPEIHYYGQLAQLNDCLLRSKQYSRYLVVIDLDEFIIPRSNKSRTWMDMLVQIPGGYAYYFRNTFFRKEWGTKVTFIGKKEAEIFKLTTILKSLRETNVLPIPQRSKYIARTDAVVSLESHFVRKFAKENNGFKVPPEVGLLHHYRNWEIYDGREPRTLDLTVVTKYKDSLIKRVQNVWSSWLKGIDMGE